MYSRLFTRTSLRRAGSVEWGTQDEESSWSSTVDVLNLSFEGALISIKNPHLDGLDEMSTVVIELDGHQAVAQILELSLHDGCRARIRFIEQERAFTEHVHRVLVDAPDTGLVERDWPE